MEEIIKSQVKIKDRKKLMMIFTHLFPSSQTNFHIKSQRNKYLKLPKILMEEIMTIADRNG